MLLGENCFLRGYIFGHSSLFVSGWKGIFMEKGVIDVSFGEDEIHYRCLDYSFGGVWEFVMKSHCNVAV